MSSTHVFLTLVLASGCCMWTTQVSAIQFNFNFNFKQWMPMHSRPQPSQCKDLKDTCPEWVYFGFCDNPEYETYMTIYCNKSCNMCSGGNRVQPRIIGGIVAAPQSHKYMASVQECKSGRCRRHIHICGGTLIKRNWVLTAAHCFDGKEGSTFSVVLGTNKPRIPERPFQRRFVKEKIIHPHYNARNWRNDIALLKLETPAKITDYVKLAYLAPLRYDVTGMECTVAGWGLTIAGQGPNPDPSGPSNDLKELSMAVKDSSECGVSQSSLPLNVDYDHICAKAEGTATTCKGDSGGPLMCGGYLSGVVSHEKRLCLGTTPVTFTRVSYFREWIDDNMH